MGDSDGTDGWTSEGRKGPEPFSKKLEEVTAFDFSLLLEEPKP
jgi:hypothetical protein